MSAPVGVDRAGRTATVTIERPDRHNAVDAACLEELGRVADELAADPDLVAVVLTGSGPSFCAGADVGDLGTFVEQSDDELRADFEAQLDVLRRLQELPVVTVASVRGVALGFGVALAASCDLVVADSGARFGLPEVQLGMAPAMVLPSLTRRLGRGHAMRLALGARQLTAAEAGAIGLVDVVAGERPLDEVVADLVAEITANDPTASRHAVRLVRELMDGRPVDAASESVTALRSPAVADALARFRS